MPVLDADEGEHPRHPHRHGLAEVALARALARSAGAGPGGRLGEGAAGGDDAFGLVAYGAAEGDARPDPAADRWFHAVLLAGEDGEGPKSRQPPTG